MLEKLIEYVRNERVLYDTTHPDYAKRKIKDCAWDRIAKQMKCKNGWTAKEKWMKLRNCHRDALRRKSFLNKSGFPSRKCWRYEEQMQFLLEYMEGRKILENEINESQNIDLLIFTEPFATLENIGLKDDPDILDSQPSKNLEKLQMEEIFMEDNFENKDFGELAFEQGVEGTKERELISEWKKSELHDEDTLFLFFLSMYKSVKEMPPVNQFKIKKQIFNIISTEEENLLE